MKEVTTMIEVQESVQTMHADNDTLIITDPCYLMRDEHWQHYCDMEFSKYPIGLDNYLRQYLSFGEVIAADTGYGDWSNKVFTVDESNTVLGEFAADAGMVCVVTASDLTNYGYDREQLQDYVERGLVTVIPNYSGDITLEYHTKDGMRLAVLMGTGETSEDVSWTTLDWSENE